mmetsp:Transcript_37227/g.93456  ORF Transcript_37227/g.93456 Transcript_37227/m.93456 type:complete len:337 (+) Transcript_37227:5887-6897(+)
MVGEEGTTKAGVDETEHLLGSEPEGGLREVVLLGEANATDGDVIGAEHAVHALVEEAAQRVHLEAGDGLGLQVGGETHLDGDTSVHHVLQQRRVLFDGHSVPDALRTTVANAVANALPAGGLAAVQCAVDAVLAQHVEGGAVQLAAEAVLGPGQVEGDHALLAVAPADLGQTARHVRTQLAHAAHDDAHRDGQVELGHHLAFDHGAHHLAQTHAALRVQHRREAHLQVAHTVGRSILSHLVHDARDGKVPLQHAQGDPEAAQVLHQRCTITAYGHQRTQLFHIGTGQFHTLLLGQLDDGLNADTSIKMTVKLSLGQLAKEFQWNGRQFLLRQRVHL